MISFLFLVLGPGTYNFMLWAICFFLALDIFCFQHVRGTWINDAEAVLPLIIYFIFFKHKTISY